MNAQHPQPANATGPRVDGIDVAQLLRDLGEASAASSAVDLFGLCLNAQRVLARVHAASGTAPDEIALMAAFRAMDDNAQRDMLCVMESVAEVSPRRAPAVLTLVPGDQRLRGGA